MRDSLVLMGQNISKGINHDIAGKGIKKELMPRCQKSRRCMIVSLQSQQIKKYHVKLSFLSGNLLGSFCSVSRKSALNPK